MEHWNIRKFNKPKTKVLKNLLSIEKVAAMFAWAFVLKRFFIMKCRILIANDIYNKKLPK